jgi:hypothetical protein
MTEYARTEQQQYPNQPYNTYNQVNQNWENINMPAQDIQSYDQAAASTSATHWNGTSSFTQNTYQTNGQNGICDNYLLNFKMLHTFIHGRADYLLLLFFILFYRDFVWLRCVSIRTTFNEPHQRTSKHSKWHISKYI